MNLHSTMYLLNPRHRHAQAYKLRHLRSTMYLLNQNLIILIIENIRNLHSTMYLLNPSILHNKRAISKFTFHYVSIKSIHFQRPPLFHRHLHSTMYLLNRILLYISNLKWFRFTFHYVSIKSPILSASFFHSL